MIKKFFAIGILFLATVMPMLVDAHEVKKTGNLEILLHNDPEDDPIAREMSQLYFSVTDLKEKFSFSDCLCRVSISLGEVKLLDRTLSTQDEAPDWGLNVSKVDYTFPKRGLYVVTIEGQSKSKLYPPFQLDYDVRVERESATPEVLPPPVESNNFLKNYYVIGGILIVSGIIVYELFTKLRKKNK